MKNPSQRVHHVKLITPPHFRNNRNFVLNDWILCQSVVFCGLPTLYSVVFPHCFLRSSLIVYDGRTPWKIPSRFLNIYSLFPSLQWDCLWISSSYDENMQMKIQLLSPCAWFYPDSFKKFIPGVATWFSIY